MCMVSVLANLVNPSFYNGMYMKSVISHHWALSPLTYGCYLVNSCVQPLHPCSQSSFCQHNVVWLLWIRILFAPYCQKWAFPNRCFQAGIKKNIPGIHFKLTLSQFPEGFHSLCWNKHEMTGKSSLFTLSYTSKS